MNGLGRGFKERRYSDMDKVESLEQIKKLWNKPDIKLGEKILGISNYFYAAGLNVSTTAAYINATPVELDSFLALGGLSDNIIGLISEVNPPKTTWTMLANASDEEVYQALNALGEKSMQINENKAQYTFSEFVYQKMLEISGPTRENKVGNLSGDDLKHALKKGEDFRALNDWEKKFLKSIVAQKKKGKVLSDKQILQLIKILESLINSQVIIKESIDDDQDICDRILLAMGK